MGDGLKRAFAAAKATRKVSARERRRGIIEGVLALTGLGMTVDCAKIARDIEKALYPGDESWSARRVWKFTLGGRCWFELPTGAEIVAVQVQQGTPKMWVLVDPTLPAERREFALFATDEEVPDGATYHGTVQLASGYVFHLFEVL